jgi:hypothetical protein
MSSPLLARLGIVYGQPESHDPVAYLAEIAKMIARYPANVQERAADLILRTHRGRSFPKPNDIVTACEDAMPDPTGAGSEKIRHAEWLAACFVCDTEHNQKTNRREPIGFKFSARFRGHPWVEQAEREGWGKELRSHLRHAVKIRIIGEMAKNNPDINVNLIVPSISDVMPNKAWIDAAREQAERYAKAAAWRATQPEPPEAARLEAAVRRLIGRDATPEAAE